MTDRKALTVVYQPEIHLTAMTISARMHALCTPELPDSRVHLRTTLTRSTPRAGAALPDRR